MHPCSHLVGTGNDFKAYVQACFRAKPGSPEACLNIGFEIIGFESRMCRDSRRRIVKTLLLLESLHILLKIAMKGRRMWVFQTWGGGGL